MARRPRGDGPGTLHHVFARGIAHRPVFLRRRDARYFLSLLARQVRAGRIAVVAYCLMTTHLHLLLVSRTGELSAALRHVLNLYVRDFNRRHGRDGPLFRSRFGSRPVTSEAYFPTVLRYIDFNPVQAGMAATPWDFPYGSARHYVADRLPPWMDAGRVDRLLGSGAATTRRARYAALLGSRLSSAEAALVHARIRHGSSPRDDLDDLLRATPSEIREWLRTNAVAADGREAGPPYVGPEALELPAVQEELRPASAAILFAGLLHQLAACGMTEIAARMGTSRSTAGARVAAHRRRLRSDPAYLDVAARVAHTTLLSSRAPPRADGR